MSFFQSSAATQHRDPKPTDAFCRSFVSQCYNTALSGQKGKVHVVHSCHRNGGSPSYSFGCKANGVDKTKAVLNKIGGGYTVTVTQGSTVVVTVPETVYSTSTQSLTSEVDVTTTLDVTSSDTATITNTATETDTTTTISTTAIPVTYTSETTRTVTSTSTSTETVTSTATQVLVGVNPVPIVEVAISPPVAKRINAGRSTFCAAFSTGCTSECKRVSSTPKLIVCQAKDSLHYRLTCYCKNRKVETQHALAAAMNQQHIATVSTVATSTTYATVTATTVVPTIVLSTSVHTLTSTIPVTSTYTTSATLTVTSTVTATASTGTPTTVSTTVSTGTATATASATTTTTATSTTQIVLAATGAVQAFSAADNSDQGYLYKDDNYGFYYAGADRTAAITFMAVRDPASDLFQLQHTDGSGKAFIAEAGNSGPTFAAGTTAYTWTYPGAPSLCGAAASRGAPADGYGNFAWQPCQTYVFGPQADAETLAQGATVVLQSEWFNPSETLPGQYYWVLDRRARGLFGVASPSGFSQGYGDPITQVNLRFPA